MTKSFLQIPPPRDRPYRVVLPEAAMNARLEALNHAARTVDFSEIHESAIAQVD